jgi:hypothetical protein
VRQGIAGSELPGNSVVLVMTSIQKARLRGLFVLMVMGCSGIPSLV